MEYYLMEKRSENKTNLTWNNAIATWGLLSESENQYIRFRHFDNKKFDNVFSDSAKCYLID